MKVGMLEIKVEMLEVKAEMHEIVQKKLVDILKLLLMK